MIAQALSQKNHGRCHDIWSVAQPVWVSPSRSHRPSGLCLSFLAILKAFVFLQGQRLGLSRVIIKLC